LMLAPGAIPSDHVLELQIGPESAKDVSLMQYGLLTAVQSELLMQFEKSGFLVPQDEVETFAKARGLFRNQLVESINEVCYEIIDDVLIEEDSEDYAILESYYRTIISQ